MPVPTTIYLKREGNDEWIPLEGVTDYRIGVRRVPDGWYRDGASSLGSAEVRSATSSAVPLATVPVYGAPDQSPTAESYSSLRYAASDEVSHIPPRTRYVDQEGYYVAVDNAVIPDVEQPASRISAFAAATTDICTTPTTSPFFHGDIVAVVKNGNTLTGPSETARYIYIRLSDTTFKLMTEQGTLVDISAITAGNVYTLILLENRQRRANLPSGVSWYPFPCDLALVDPRL